MQSYNIPVPKYWYIKQAYVVLVLGAMSIVYCTYLLDCFSNIFHFLILTGIFIAFIVWLINSFKHRLIVKDEDNSVEIQYGFSGKKFFYIGQIKEMRIIDATRPDRKIFYTDCTKSVNKMLEIELVGGTTYMIGVTNDEIFCLYDRIKNSSNIQLSEKQNITIKKSVSPWQIVLTAGLLVLFIALSIIALLYEVKLLFFAIFPLEFMFVFSSVPLFRTVGKVEAGKMTFSLFNYKINLSDIESYSQVKANDKRFVYQLNLSNGKHIKISVRIEDVELFNKLMDKRFEEKG